MNKRWLGRALVGAILIGILVGYGLAHCQQPAPAPLISAYETQLLYAQLPPVPSGSAFIVGSPGPGTAFYWIVAKFNTGNATPVRIEADFVPNVLSGSNLVRLNWSTPSTNVPSGTTITYDVLKTLTNQLPNGTATIALATGLAVTTVDDTGQALNSYTVNTLPPNTIGFDQFPNGFILATSPTPALSAANSSRFFYDATVPCFKQSLNGAAFVCIAGAGGAGTVTSVSAGNLSPLFTTSVTNPNTTPNIAFAQISQAANLVFASPNGAPGNPTFRALVSADLPPGTGTVTSVGLALPVSTFSIAGSPVTTSGTLTGAFINQTANTFLSGPASGVPAVPTWRLLVTADLPPGTGTVTSVGLALPASVFSVSGSPVTTSGTLTGAFINQTANTVFAGPSSGAPALPTFRALVFGADVGCSGALVTNAIIKWNGANCVSSTVVDTGAATVRSPNGLNVDSSPLTFERPNDSVTATVANGTVKYSGAVVGGQAAVTAALTTDSTLGTVVGCLQSGAGTVGNAEIAEGGIKPCLFDNVATVAGHLVGESTTVNNTLKDLGTNSAFSLTAGVQILGRVQETHAPCGAPPCGPYNVAVNTTDLIDQVAIIRGKASPAGVPQNVQFNRAGVFGANANFSFDDTVGAQALLFNAAAANNAQDQIEINTNATETEGIRVSVPASVIPNGCGTLGPSGFYIFDSTGSTRILNLCDDGNILFGLISQAPAGTNNRPNVGFIMSAAGGNNALQKFTAGSADTTQDFTTTDRFGAFGILGANGAKDLYLGPGRVVALWDAVTINAGDYLVPSQANNQQLTTNGTVWPCTSNSTVQGQCSQVIGRAGQNKNVGGGANTYIFPGEVKPGAYGLYMKTQTAQVAAIADTTMFTVGGTSALFRFTGTINCTTTSAAATATLNLKYTDTGSAAQTVSVTDTCTALVTTGIPNLVVAIRAKNGTAITWGVTIANTPTYDVDVRLEQF